VSHQRAVTQASALRTVDPTTLATPLARSTARVSAVVTIANAVRVRGITRFNFHCGAHWRSTAEGVQDFDRLARGIEADHVRHASPFATRSKVRVAN
jgi:hypothetical protein